MGQATGGGWGRQQWEKRERSSDLDLDEEDTILLLEKVL